MFEGGSSHHVEDVGRILLQVQDNIKSLRASLGRSNTVANLDEVLARAEKDLRVKAEVVLNSVIQNRVHTLPSIKPGSADGATGGAGAGAGAGGGLGGTAGGGRAPQAPARGSPRRRRRPRSQPKPATRVRDRLLEAQTRDHFDINNEDHRQLLRHKYGVPFKAPHERKLVNGRQAGRVPNSTGRRWPGKLTKSNTLLPLKNRRDPHEPPPPVTDDDVRKGILSLVTRGLLPPSVDVTAAFDEGRCMVQQPVRMHDFTTQFQPQSVYTSPFGFNAATIKLDLAPQHPQGPPAMPTRPRPPRQRAAATTTLEYSGPVKTTRQPRLPQAPVPHIVDPATGGGEDEEPTAEDKLRDAIDKIRGYNELLDEFSLHQFIIRRGRVLDSTPEFASYKRTHAAQWGPITIVVSALERLLSQYGVPTAYIDGQAVALLASDELAAANPSKEALMQCIANIDQVAPLLQVPGRRFVGPRGQDHAATAIQATFRMYLCRMAFLGKRSLSQAVRRIQHTWRGYRDAKATRAKLRAAQLAAEDEWVAMMENFRRRWPTIQRRRRVVVHVPSISAEEHVRWAVPHFSTRQNLQMARLCAVADPLVDVVYVAPFAITDDLRSYYQKLLSIGGVGGVGSRFKIVVPENLSRFPGSMSLTSAVLYSPRCLRRLAHFCRGKEAYIVPGTVGPEDKRLSMVLKLPLLAPEPSLAALYSTKSGAKRIFSMADVNIPVGAHDIYEEQELVAALASLTAANVHVKRWLFKIDDEFGGRGHAYLDVGHLKIVQVLRRKRDGMTAEEWAAPELQEEAVGELTHALKRNLSRRAVIVYPKLYQSWKAFLKAFTRLGGIIEAAAEDVIGSPSVNLFISPGGGVQVTSAHEQLFTKPYHQLGVSFPQQSVPYPALVGAAEAIGRVLVKQGVMGYVGIDFVTFMDKSVGAQRLWAVDLNLRLTSSACSFALFNFLMGGELDPKTGQYIVDTTVSAADDLASTAGSEISQRTASQPVNALLGDRRPSMGSMSTASALSAMVGGGARAGAGSRKGSTASARRKDGTLAPGFEYRSYVSFDFVFHPNLATLQYASFFNLCRLQGISFDLHERVGTAFVLVDSMAAGIIGMLSVGRSPGDSGRTIGRGLDFIVSQVGLKSVASEWDDEDGNFEDVVKCARKVARTGGSLHRALSTTRK